MEINLVREKKNSVYQDMPLQLVIIKSNIVGNQLIT